jgi:hypothetical protein
MTVRMLVAAIVACTAILSGCGRDAPPPAAGTGSDTADIAAPPGVGPQERWPAPGAGDIHVRRDRAHDLTGDGRAERLSVTVRGNRYDSLDIVLLVEGADGDTLWRDEWTSLYYFHYDPLEGKTDTEVAQIVQGHVDALLVDDRFHTGMPDRMLGGDPTEMVHESVRYHLAELDWRHRADLYPSDSTPVEAWDRLQPEMVGDARVRAVADELASGPTYNYFAGGEASYVIGWSVRENAFVRLFACC